jgi:mycothiol synthase
MKNSTIDPTPPNLPGIIWRPITRDDIATLIDLVHKCYVSDGGLHFLFEPDEIIGRYFPEAAGAAIGAFTADEQLVACNTIYISGDSGTPQATIIGLVQPDQRGRGIGTYLMRWSQVQAESLLTDSTTHQRVLHIRTESLTETASHLYLAHGFASVREDLVMRRDLDLPLPEHALPPEVTLTSWQPDLAEQFYQAYDAAFRERPGFPGLTTAAWIENWTVDNDPFRPEWSLLARADDVPLGFLLAATNPPHGFVMQVGVVPTQRGRGLGSGLIVETMRRMQAGGLVSIQLIVNVNNPDAIKVYDKLGFVTIGRRAHYERSDDYQ